MSVAQRPSVAAAAFRRLRRLPAALGREWAVRRDLAAFRRQVVALAAPAAANGRSRPRVLIISLSNWVAQVKVECVLARALEDEGWEAHILTSRRHRRAVRYFRAFGLTRLRWVEDVLSVMVWPEAQRIAAELLPHPLTSQRLKALRHRGVNVGRQVLASVSRMRYRTLRLDDPQVAAAIRTQLPEAVQSVAAAEALLETLHPSLVVFLDKDYLVLGSVCDAAVNRGIPVIQWCASQRDDGYTLKRYTAANRNAHPQSLSDATWRAAREMPWTPAHDEAVLREFDERYRDAKWTSYYNRPSAQFTHDAQTLRQQLGLDPAKRTAIIFSHILWDSTFFWGEDLFEDYGEWLVETVRAACANPALNWVVRLHPANRWKLEREAVREELYDYVLLRERIGPLPPHVTVLDPQADVNTFSLFPVTDYCLTVRGTIGLEMACFGIPAVTAGTGRYSGLGFTVDSGSRAEYLDRLAHLQALPRLSAEQAQLARRYGYALWIQRPWVVTTFRQVYLPIRRGGHPLDHNVRISARSAAELAEAPDLRAFARWAARSSDEDYLQPSAVMAPQGVACAVSSG